MKRFLQRTRRVSSIAMTVVMFSGGAVVIAGCEEEEAQMARPVDPRKRKPGGGGGAEGPDPTKQVTIKLTKPRWLVLEPHFKKLLDQKHAPAKDIFKPQVLNLIPRPELPKEELDVEGDGVDEVVVTTEEPKGPLQMFPVKDYELMMIMSGTALPKAVVVDPQGQAFAVQEDTRIGDRGGIIESISQYSMVIREPNQERPYVLNIQPPFVDLASRLDGGAGGPTTPPEMLSAPAADIK